MLQVMEIDHGSLLDSIACCPGSMYWTKLYKTDAWWCVQQGRAQGQQVGKQTPMAVSSWRNGTSMQGHLYSTTWCYLAAISCRGMYTSMLYLT